MYFVLEQRLDSSAKWTTVGNVSAAASPSIVRREELWPKVRSIVPGVELRVRIANDSERNEMLHRAMEIALARPTTALTVVPDEVEEEAEYGPYDVPVAEDWQLVSLLPDQSPKVKLPMVIETAYLDDMEYTLDWLDPSLEGDAIEDIIEDRFFDANELLYNEQDENGSENEYAYRAWHLIPLFAQQFVWHQDDGEWRRGMAKTAHWFQPNRRYCIMAQSFGEAGVVLQTRLGWLLEDDELEASEHFDTLTCTMQVQNALLVGYTVYEPQLLAAYAVLRPSSRTQGQQQSAD
jgi:hypothetical protein